ARQRLRTAMRLHPRIPSPFASRPGAMLRCDAQAGASRTRAACRCSSGFPIKARHAKSYIRMRGAKQSASPDADAVPNFATPAPLGASLHFAESDNAPVHADPRESGIFGYTKRSLVFRFDFRVEGAPDPLQCQLDHRG